MTYVATVTVAVFFGAMLFFALMFWYKEVKKQAYRPEDDAKLGLMSPDGLSIVTNAGLGPNRSSLPKSTDECNYTAHSSFEIEYSCGHKAPSAFSLNLWGEESFEFKDTHLCPDCWLNRFKEHTTRCVLCGLPIFPGEGVALYSEKSPDLMLKQGTKVGESYIGCLRWDCCPSGGFFAGHWTEEGFKPLYPEGLTAAELTFKTGSVISNM